MSIGQISREEAVNLLKDSLDRFRSSICGDPTDWERGFMDGFSAAIAHVKKSVPESEIGQIVFKFEEGDE